MNDLDRDNAERVANAIWDTIEGNISDVCYAVSRYYELINENHSPDFAVNRAIQDGERRITDRIETYFAARKAAKSKK